MLKYARVTFQSIDLTSEKPSSIVQLEDIYFRASDAIIFVVDCDAWEEITEVRQALQQLLRHRDSGGHGAEVKESKAPKHRPLLVMANTDRQARNNCCEKTQKALRANEVADALRLRDLDTDRFHWVSAIEKDEPTHTDLLWSMSR